MVSEIGNEDRMTAPDPETIRKAQAGDSESITVIYDQYHSRIYRYLYYRLGDSQVAEDLTSEVFLRMLRSLHQYRIHSFSFQAWLFQIARNLSIDHYRKIATNRQVALNGQMIETVEPTDTTVQRRLDHQSLSKALSRLPDDQKDVIILRFVAGLPIYEAAQTLNKSEDSIKGLQRRALLTLRQVLVDWKIRYDG
jgi:RNA polymerase sigma-70 factor (ECF subfamily)